MVRVPHVLKLWLRSRTLHKFPCAVGARKIFLITLCLELLLTPTVSWSYLSTLKSTHLRVSDFWPWSILPTVPRSHCHFFSFIGIHRIDRIHQISVKSFSRSTGCVTPSWVVSPSLELLVLALPSESLHLKSPLDLFLTWRSALPIRSSKRKSLKWLQENIEKTHNVEQTKKMIPFVTRKTSFR